MSGGSGYGVGYGLVQAKDGRPHHRLPFWIALLLPTYSKTRSSPSSQHAPQQTQQKPEFLDYNVGVAKVTKAWEASLRSYSKVNSLQFSLLSRVSPQVRPFVAPVWLFVDRKPG